MEKRDVLSPARPAATPRDGDGTGMGRDVSRFQNIRGCAGRPSAALLCRDLPLEINIVKVTLPRDSILVARLDPPSPPPLRIVRVDNFVLSSR